MVTRYVKGTSFRPHLYIHKLPGFPSLLRTASAAGDGRLNAKIAITRIFRPLRNHIGMSGTAVGRAVMPIASILITPATGLIEELAAMWPFCFTC